MIASLTEEAEAIGWYDQRIALEPDERGARDHETLRSEEFKHFAMDLEFLLAAPPSGARRWRRCSSPTATSSGGEEAEEAAPTRRLDSRPAQEVQARRSTSYRPRPRGRRASTRRTRSRAAAASSSDRRAAQHLAGAAARVAVLLAHPQLEPGPPLVPVAVVGRRDARVVDRHRAVGVEQRGPGRLVGVALGVAGRTAVSAPTARRRATRRASAASAIRLPVRRAPRAPPLAEAVDRPPGRRPAHAAQLLVALHPAQLGRGPRAARPPRTRARSPRRPRARIAQRACGSRIRGVEPGSASESQSRRAGQTSSALRRGHRLAAREQHAERCPGLATPTRASPKNPRRDRRTRTSASR